MWEKFGKRLGETLETVVCVAMRVSRRSLSLFLSTPWKEYGADERKKKERMDRRNDGQILYVSDQNVLVTDRARSIHGLCVADTAKVFLGGCV